MCTLNFEFIIMTYYFVFTVYEFYYKKALVKILSWIIYLNDIEEWSSTYAKESSHPLCENPLDNPLFHLHLSA